jgi:hypothetical protein
MSEQIKRLAEQARIKDHWSIDEGRYLTNYLDEQKFAELIIKQCIDICEDTEGDPSADSRWGRRCCALEIKEHFGTL